MENIKQTIIDLVPKKEVLKISLEAALKYFEEKKEISCAAYEEFYNSSKNHMKKADREELFKHFKLKPDSSGYEFVKDL